ncbi:hypothetical protein ZIOFF_063735 [Zingiber officinale]|uniref:Uncharacterized protein n=1 Tax=Zingiber officinale TaxID=94328 RepID=A0A8J5F5G2_ZINOF|nr:hypothetical protein ZIOFF_063735 [Zingiber officinale]
MIKIVTLLSRPIAEEDHDDCEDEEYYGNSKEGKGDEHAIKEKRLLEYLRPHANLKMLQIYDYPGVSFAKWVGTSSFSKPVQLWLCRCRKCNFLPPLGQLHSLKILCIQEMDGMHIVGREFCSSPMVKAFPSLESLAFVRMPNWEVWDEVEVGDFPHLQHIKLYECPKLTKFPHHLMSSVKELSIKADPSCTTIEQEMTKLKKTMRRIQVQLAISEDHDSSSSEQVKLWLSELKDIAYAA